MNTQKRVPFYVPWITEEDREAVSQALNSRWLTGGPRTTQFESMFAEYIGVEHAVAVNSCTAALHIAMLALKIGHGDEVIVPDFTFAATANAPIFCGAKPVFADVDEKTFNISPQDILNRKTRNTRAIIPVHYGGQSCDMKEIIEIAEDNRLHVVEDCAHSLGSVYKGAKTGSLGEVGCFSFYPTKIITAIEGGMITTNDGEIAKKAKMLREHGMTRTASQREAEATWYYDVEDLGYNYRLNEVQAALGTSQLERVEEGIFRRVEVANLYTSKLQLDAVTPPHQAPERSHIFHLYVIKLRSEKTRLTRDELFSTLHKEGIETSVHYTPLHRLSYYRKLLNSKPDSYPVSERVYNQVLSLPLYPTLTNRNIDFVAETIKKAVAKAA